MRSRLKTHIKHQNKKTFFIIIILLVLVVMFGMKFIVGFSVLLEKIRSPKDELLNTQGIDYIAPPVLDPLPAATKNPKAEVSGYSSSSTGSIKLYINGELVDSIHPKTDKSFSFDNVPLNSGDNEIRARVEDEEGKKSGYSQIVKISYLNTNPELEITAPQEGQTFKKDESPIKVSGKTDNGVRVTVNDFWAIGSDDGTFYYMHNLKDGENNLKITATDNAGNKTEKEVKIRVE